MLRTQKSGRASITTAATTIGFRLYSDLINAVRSHKVHLTATATVTVAGGITSVRNRGSVWALFDAIGVEENGVDKVNLIARQLRFISEMFAPSALFASRMGVANAAYNLREDIIISFAHPLSIAPNETAFVEADPRQALRVFVTYNGTVANLGAVGAGSITINTPPTVYIEQEYDDKRNEAPPTLIPFYREIVQSITAAVTNFPVYLKGSRYIRALSLMQNTNVGEVNDIVTALTLRGDARDFIGPQPVPLGNLQDDSLSEFGGDVLGGGGLILTTEVPRRCYLGFNAQRNGRLSSIINPAFDTNLRFEVNGQPSVTTGATSSEVRVGMLELEEVPGLTVPAEARGYSF